MTKPSYWELLRDPRWQRKRLEIMERDEWSCVECGASGDTLNVHHGYYAKGRNPWEYEDSTLRTLCENCHKRTEDVLGQVRRIMGDLSFGDLETLRGFLQAYAGADVSNDSPDACIGISMALRVHMSEVDAVTDEMGAVDVGAIRREAARKDLIVRAIRDIVMHIDGPNMEGETDDERPIRTAALRVSLEAMARRLVNAKDQPEFTELMAARQKLHGGDDA